MPQKQKVETKKNQNQKRIGFHILSVAMITLIFVGGSVFLLLSPLLTPFLSQAGTSYNGEDVPQSMDEKMTVYLDRSSATDTIVLKKNNESVLNKNMKPLLKVSKNSQVLSYVNSEDKNIIVFSVSSISDLDFLKDQINVDNFISLPDQQISSVFIYDKIKNKLNFLFSSNAISSKSKYIYPMSIKNSRYVSFENKFCNECGVGVREGAVIDLQTKSMKELGPIVELRWLENGMYEYKQYIPEKCPIEIEIGECFKDPATVPFLKAELK